MGGGAGRGSRAVVDLRAGFGAGSGLGGVAGARGRWVDRHEHLAEISSCPDASRSRTAREVTQLSSLANFPEPHHGEVPRIPLPGTW